MKNLLHIIIAAVALSCAAGCATKNSPARTAHTATDTALSTADAAMFSWKSYVQAERAEIERLKPSDPGLALDKANRLLVKEGQVSAAYYKYQAAATAAVNLGAANAANPDNVVAQIAAAAAPLVEIVTAFTSKK